MTNSPNPGNEPEPTSGDEPQQASARSLRQRQQRRLGLVIFIILLAVIGGGGAWVWFFVYKQLGPQVETTLTKLLNRPIKLGKVESFSLNSLRFGATEVPTTPTDSDRASIQSVDVAFNPVPLLLRRTLELDVTLVKPNAYIDQSKDGNWVNTKLQSLEKGAIDVKLQVLRLRNADVVLVPRGAQGNPKTPVALKVSSGTVRFLNENKLIRLNLAGQLVNGGNFKIAGESRPSLGETNLALSGSDLGAAEIGRLIQLPLLLQAGKLNGNLEVNVLPNQPLQFLGTASLENVTARLAVLPKPFAKTNGQLRFKGTEVRLEKITTLFGQIPAQANGVLDTQSAINLSARTQPVQVKQVLQTFNFKQLPVAVSGEVQAALRVTGLLSKPIVSGEFASTKPTQIDRVNFRSVSASFGLVDSTASVNNLRAVPTVGGLVTGKGQVQLGQKGRAVFEAQATNVPGDAIARNYGIDLPVPIGSVSGRTQIFVALDNPQNPRAIGSANINVAGGTLRASNVQLDRDRFRAQVQAVGIQVERLAQVPPQLRGPLSGTFNLSGPVKSFNIAAIRGSGSGRLNIAGGTVNATDVELRNGGFTAQVEASGIRVERLAQLPPQLQKLQGPLSGSFNLSGPLTSFNIAAIRGSGSGRLNIAGGTVNATDVELRNGGFTAQVEAEGVRVERLAQLPPQLQELQGPVSGTFNLSGPLTSFNIAAIRGSGSGRLNIAGGTVNATDVELRNGGFIAQVEAEGVRVERLAQLPPQLQELQGPLSGSFNLSGPLTSFNIAAIRGSGSGQLNIAGGTVNATNVELRNGAFIARVEAREVQVERLAQVPPQLRGFVSGTFNFSGPVTSFNLAAIRGSGSGQLNIADGTVNATDVQLRNGSFTARVRTEGVQLAGFSQDLQGRLGGNLNVSGSLTALSPSAIQARGQLNFSEGIALIDRPLTASISWNGQQLEIQQATANGFNANGVVNVNLANRGLQAIEGFNLNVRARDLNLQRLPAIVPNAVNLAGRADFEGRIAGTPTDPNVKGDLQLRDFVAGGLTFEPLLAGTVNAVPGQGVNLQLRGNEDRINVALAPNYQPVSFLVRTQGAVATGTRSGGELVVAVENFPIDTIKAFVPTSSLPAQTRTLAAQPLSGRLSGNLAVNLNTYGISGNVAIANPIFGTLRGDSFIGTIQYNNGVVALTNGEFKQGDNRYLLSANLTQTSKGPQFQAKLDVAQGELQDVLTALQIFDLSDLNRGLGAPTYGKAADVATAPAGLPQAPLQNQLRRLSEIEAILQQREESEAASPLPELAEAKGRFTGTVNVVGSLSSGISAEFNIQGQNWQWGPYSANEVIAQGGFQDGVLTLLPLRFQSGDRVANFAGTLGGDAQSGQLQLRNIPIDQLQAVLQKVTDLPPALTGFTGLLNATATLSGSVKNPQARGELTITDATLNQTPVQSAQGSFSYNNARLNFGSTVLVAQTDPLTISGSVPFKLPIASVEPENNQLNLDINVQNEGLALLNLLSGGQVTWLNGTGNVQLKVSGIIDPKTNRPTQLVAQGIAAVDKATIGARALPEALTNVTGNVLFDFDRILVQAVRGQFSGGTIAAAGTIPISQPASLENPLTVNIGELALNLKGLYRGGVRGNVTVTGTALAPELSGNVNLYNGQVQLLGAGGTTAGGTSTADGSVGGTPASSSNNTTGFKIGLSGLQLTLDRDIQLTLAPIVNFLAKGTLTVNGSLDNPSPEGTIRLERGQVNLFTTQFRLARDYENTARFVANRGRDPVVDVRLQAAVTEATQRRLPSDPLSAEISDTLTAANFGSVQTVRIQAKAQGPVSQLADNLELTSTPARSEAEIIALLGGSFVDTLGQGDSTLGLVNLAGSALLSNVQNAIGDALGLSEFRLFPTTIIDDKQRTSTLGLAAEAGVDITRSFSVSILKELTNDQPFQYSLRYRLSDKLLLRGSTDLSGDSRAVLEYENRF